MCIRLRRASPSWPGFNDAITRRISRIVSVERQRAKESGAVGLEETNRDIISCARRAVMEDAGAKVVDLIFGRWRSHILYTGVKLGVFDALARGPLSAVRVASELGVDAGMLYRLMRALGSLELLKEDTNRTFCLTPMAEVWTHFIK
jgi:Dimerisation domain